MTPSTAWTLVVSALPLAAIAGWSAAADIMLNDVCVRRRSSKSGRDRTALHCPPNGVTRTAVRSDPPLDVGKRQTVDDRTGSRHRDAGTATDRKDGEEWRGDETGDGEPQAHLCMLDAFALSVNMRCHGGYQT
jgi:hypothetical protein